MPDLTLPEAVRLLKEVVSERGEDYVYSAPGGMCAYFDRPTGKPSCGIGVVLAKLGVTIDDLRDRHHGFNSLNVGAGVGTLAYNGVLCIDGDRTARLLGKFQEEQDQGTSYGVALALALRAAGVE